MSFKLLRLVSCWNTPGPLGWLDHPSGVENLADSQVILGVNNIWWFQFYDNQLQVLLYYYSVLFIIIFFKKYFLVSYYLLFIVILIIVTIFTWRWLSTFRSHQSIVRSPRLQLSARGPRRTAMNPQARETMVAALQRSAGNLLAEDWVMDNLQHVKLLMIHRKYDVDDGGPT